MEVRGFEVGKLIGESPQLRLYLASKEQQQYIMKVAKTFEDGDILATEAGWFKRMSAFEKEVAKLEKETERKPSRYELLFAELIDSFMEASQDDRRINILAMPEVSLDALTPLAKLRAETHIDARTSVWILGRLFKLYSFYELIAESGDCPVITYTTFAPGDYLIAPRTHRLVYYNHTGGIQDLSAHTYVKAITQFILDWTIFDDSDANEHAYHDLLLDLASIGGISCEYAHEQLYNLVRKAWGIKYYPFTYQSPDSNVWRNIEEE